MSTAEQHAMRHARNIKQEQIAIKVFPRLVKELQHSQELLERIAGADCDPASAYQALDIENLLKEVNV